LKVGVTVVHALGPLLHPGVRALRGASHDGPRTCFLERRCSPQQLVQRRLDTAENRGHGPGSIGSAGHSPNRRRGLDEITPPVIELVVGGASRRRATWRDAHLRSITPVRPTRHAVEPADGDDVRSTSGVIREPICGGDRMAGARRASDAARYGRTPIRHWRLAPAQREDARVCLASRRLPWAWEA
jgi:hypothetical protein